MSQELVDLLTILTVVFCSLSLISTTLILASIALGTKARREKEPSENMWFEDNEP